MVYFTHCWTFISFVAFIYFSLTFVTVYVCGFLCVFFVAFECLSERVWPRHLTVDFTTARHQLAFLSFSPASLAHRRQNNIILQKRYYLCIMHWFFICRRQRSVDHLFLCRACVVVRSSSSSNRLVVVAQWDTMKLKSVVRERQSKMFRRKKLKHRWQCF